MYMFSYGDHFTLAFSFSHAKVWEVCQPVNERGRNQGNLREALAKRTKTRMLIRRPLHTYHHQSDQQVFLTHRPSIQRTSWPGVFWGFNLGFNNPLASGFNEPDELTLMSCLQVRKLWSTLSTHHFLRSCWPGLTTGGISVAWIADQAAGHRYHRPRSRRWQTLRRFGPVFVESQAPKVDVESQAPKIDGKVGNNWNHRTTILERSFLSLWSVARSRWV